jgi:hypothetical protein
MQLRRHLAGAVAKPHQTSFCTLFHAPVIVGDGSELRPPISLSLKKTKKKTNMHQNGITKFVKVYSRAAGKKALEKAPKVPFLP